MIGWLDANSNNRKTPRGIKKFINGWLSRAQDSARPASNRQNTEKTPTPNRFHNFEQRDVDYDAMVQQQTLEWLRKEGELDG